MQFKHVCLFSSIFATITSSAMAGPWLYAGPAYEGTPASGFVNAHMNGNPHHLITNDGYAVGDATQRNQIVFDGGTRALRFSASGWTSFDAISYENNGVAQVSALAINASHTVVGTSKRRSANGTDLGIRAVRWPSNSWGPVVELNPINTDTDGSVFSSAVAINDSGLTVGTSGVYTPGGTWKGNRAVKWLPNSSTPVELPITVFNQSASGFSNTFGVALNNAGAIVGTTEGYDNNQQFAGKRAIRWKPNNTYAVLNPLGYNASNQTMCEAVDINEAGVTVGVSDKYDYNDNQKFVGRRAVRWAYDTISGQELGGLGGTDINGTTYAQVSSVSDAGLILGASNKYLLGTAIGNRAVYWSTTGSTAANELPHLGTSAAGITHGRAHAANADGYVVGYAEKYSGGALVGDRAVLWKTAGADTATDLNTLLQPNSGWTLTEAKGITDTGFVTGTGTFDPDGAGGASPYTRLFTMLIPSAGTYGRGDANFDTVTDFADLLLLAQRYGMSNPYRYPWMADLNLDQVTNFDDLLIVAQNYGAGALVNGAPSEAFMADWALAQSMVPEPTSLVALAGLGMMARRRR